MDDAAQDRTYPLLDAHPRAVVIHCGDPRFQKAFGEFIRTELQLQDGDYIPVVVSGAVASLTEPLKLPKEFKFMKDRLEFLFERFDTINRVVLINHEDCRHYDAMREALGKVFLLHVPHMTERQVRDLKLVGKMLAGYASGGRQIELYFARITADHSVRFERI